MFNQQKLKCLASQLACPSGAEGVSLGYTMNTSNLSLTLNGIYNLNIMHQDKILELGHGNAGHLAYLLSLAEDIHYTGLEISQTMYSEAMSINKGFVDNGLAHFELYDGTSLPFSEESFDKILSVNTVYFWASPKNLVTSICRALKTGGLFCLTFCDKAFMAKLPFTQFNFKLYEVADIEELFSGLPMTLMTQDTKQDKVISKAGSLVNRQFYSLVYKKY